MQAVQTCRKKIVQYSSKRPVCMASQHQQCFCFCWKRMCDRLESLFKVLPFTDHEGFLVLEEKHSCKRQWFTTPVVFLNHVLCESVVAGKSRTPVHAWSRGRRHGRGKHLAPHSTLGPAGGRFRPRVRARLASRHLRSERWEPWNTV